MLCAVKQLQSEDVQDFVEICKFCWTAGVSPFANPHLSALMASLQGATTPRLPVPCLCTAVWP